MMVAQGDEHLSNPTVHQRATAELTEVGIRLDSDRAGSLLTNYLLMRLVLALEAVAGEMHGINEAFQQPPPLMVAPDGTVATQPPQGASSR